MNGNVIRSINNFLAWLSLLFLEVLLFSQALKSVVFASVKLLPNCTIKTLTKYTISKIAKLKYGNK